MVRITLGDVLKKKRISKRKFAKMLGIRYENVFRFFRTGYDPKMSILESWASMLKCKIKDLYKE